MILYLLFFQIQKILNKVLLRNGKVLIIHIPENGDNPLLLDFQTKAFILERMFKNEKLKKINVAFFKNYGEKIHIASFNREELDFLANTCNEFNYKNFKKLKYEYDVNNSVGEYTLLEEN